MAAIKNYTDLSQSKVLSQILPHETADMCYKCIEEDPYDVVLRPYSEWKEEYKGLLVNKEVDVIPCWSFTALLEVLPNENMLVKTTDKEYYCLAKDIMTKHYNNPIDACYEMVLELKRKELL